MKRLMAWVCLLLFLTSSMYAQPAPSNLLSNPGFESKDGWRANWEWANVKSRMQIIHDPAAAFSGSGVMEIECTSYHSGATQVVSNPFSLAEGQAYRMRFEYRGQRLAKVSFIVRQIAGGWTEYARKEVSPVLEWNAGELFFVAPKNVNAVAVYITFEGEGKLFVDDVSVIPTDLPRVKPEHTGNMLANASFELPISYTDWGLELFGPVAVIKENATDGRQCLSVNKKSDLVRWGEIRGNLLRSGALQLRQFCDHTLAADLRADNPTQVTLALLDGDLKLAQKTFDVGTSWQRFSVTGNSLVAERAYVAILSKGPFQVDRVYLGEGTQEPALYAPRAPIESFLCVTAAPSKMFVSGQPVNMQIAVAATEQKKSGEHVNYSVMLEHWDGKTEQAAQGTLAIAADPETIQITPTRNGPYRVFLKVEGAPDSRDGFVVVAPRAGPPAQNSPFGGHTMLSEPMVADIVRKMGIASARLHWPPDLTQWRAVEPARGKWKFNDEAFQRYQQNHMEMIGILQSTPHWAAAGKKLSMGTSNYSMAMPDQMNDWNNYCRTVASHWPQIRYWELFNEPNVGIFWPGTNEELMELSRQAIASVRKVNSEARFLVTNHPSLEVLAKAGVLKDVAALSEHWYAHGSTVDARVDQISEWIRKLRSELAQLGASQVELWNTEFGPGNWGGIMAGNEKDYRRGVEYISKHLSSQRALNVGRFHPYLIGLSTGATNFAAIEKDGTPSSGLAAYAAVIQILERATPAGEMPLADKTFRAYQFKQGEKLIVYAWSREQGKTLSLPALPDGVQALDVFANPLSGDISLDFIPIVLIGPEQAVRGLLPAAPLSN